MCRLNLVRSELLRGIAVLLALSLQFVWSPTALAATTEWTGDVGNDGSKDGVFNDSANWDNGVPGSSDTAHFFNPTGSSTPSVVDFTNSPTNDTVLIVHEVQFRGSDAGCGRMWQKNSFTTI